MADDIYPKLASHLDALPGGFPATEAGVELRILKRLFTPEEAELALCLTLLTEPPRVVARRAGLPVAQTARRLEAMACKGLVFRVEKSTGFPEYMIAQYVIGIWEFQVGRLTPGLIRDMDAYKPHLMNTAWKQPQLRTIPVGQSIHADLPVMTYERAEELVRNQSVFAVSPCICRREKKMTGQGCQRPEASCLSFGNAAAYATKNGYGRASSQEEILDLLRQADEHALVLQPGFAKEAGFICCCCGCCCGVLQTLKTLPRPAEFVASAFVARVDPEACVGCGICQDRCQMEAVNLVDGRVALDEDRCIGCGLCATTCPTDALKLARKPKAQQPKIPKDAVAAAIAHGRARGKLGAGELVKLVVRSKIDRLMAPG